MRVFVTDVIKIYGSYFKLLFYDGIYSIFFLNIINI